MKTIKFILLVIFISTATVFAQSPEAFKYQAAVRDNNGDLLINQNVGLRFTIRNTIPTGGILYRESHNVNTNDFGMVNINLGTGTVEAGVFANIPWGSSNKYLEVELDLAGGTSYTSMGTSQLLSVPYAMYAKEAESVPNDGDWMISGNDMYSTPSGNVGIGTNDPDAKLEVYKNAYIGGDGNVETNELVGTLGWYNNDANSLNQLVGGIDMLNTGNHWWDGSVQYLDASMIFNTMEDGVVDEAMRISHAGNLGIGMVPSEKLDVDGNIRAIAFIGDGSQLTGVSGSDNLGNHTATQNLNMANNRILNLANPSGSQDAATKFYVDNNGDNFGNHTATQTVNLANFGITNLLDPTNAQDAASKNYVDNNGDNLGSHLASQNLNMFNNRIINVTNPSAPQDAATKSYVDGLIGGDSDWGINGDHVYTGTGGSFPSGNVGIGTDNPTNAKLEISNAASVGIQVNNPGHNGMWMETPAVNGVYVNNPGYYGFAVDNSGLGGVFVDHSGEDGIFVNNSTKDGIALDNSGYWGIDINTTTFSGMRIQGTGTHGIDIYYPGQDGVQVTGATEDGITVSGANDDGVEVTDADDMGVYADATGTFAEWGIYTPDKIYGSNITTKSICTNGKNTGTYPLEVGDIVCISGGYDENVLFNGDSPIVHVEKISDQNTDRIFGVVEYKIKIRQEFDQNTSEVRNSFEYTDGIVGKDEYLSIVILGPADVKVSAKSSFLAGATLTSGNNGARKVKTTEVNGLKVAENVGTLGKALENSNGRGMIKIFVNCN